MTVHELWYSDFMVGYDYCKQLTVGYDNCKQGRNYWGVGLCNTTLPQRKGKKSGPLAQSGPGMLVLRNRLYIEEFSEKLRSKNV
jgi:hypothetical protein